jgi:aryl-phospho-beta-D-glucosidase BglC (GH1 family)
MNIPRCFKFWQWLIGAAIASLCFSFTVSWTGMLSANSPALPPLPLSAQGAQIIDAHGKPILLQGVNWFGLETETHAPHGLWARDYKEMLAQISSLGYNFIRVPFSIESLRSEDFKGIDFDIGDNVDFYGKTPLEVLDRIVAEAELNHLMIMLDCHRLNDEYISPLWYDDEFSEADWIETWKVLAERYRDSPNVIAADLKNEPHGAASWGSGDSATDWRLAAERAGNAILAVNPDWLIVVEGVESNVPDQQLETHWQGGNLEGAGRFPIRLAQPQKLVYSPHEYGPGVFEHPWFYESNFPENLHHRWQIGFQYIADKELAPILIGEFGGHQVDDESPEGVWQQTLVQFINEKSLSYAYWCWNPNSPDTGGLLLDDWQQIHEEKQTLLDTTFSSR